MRPPQWFGSKRESHERYGETEFTTPGNTPEYPSVEEWAELADDTVAPVGDQTVCWIAYQAALRLCGSDSIFKALAFAAYQACLNS